jgi:Arc/MetJ family transcription regulator
MHPGGIFMHMRTTINIDDELLRKASEATGIAEKTALVRKALENLVISDAYRRLAAMGGTMPDLKIPPRKRPGSRK